MNTAALEYIGARIVYTALYTGVRRSEAASYARSGVYGLSLAVPCWVLWRASGRIWERESEGEDGGRGI